MELVLEGIGIAGALIAFLAHYRGVSNQINKVINPVKDTQKQHGELLDSMMKQLNLNSKQLERYATNEGFYTHLKDTITKALTYLEADEDVKARRIAAYMGGCIIRFAKDLLLQDINTIPDHEVKSLAVVHISNVKSEMGELFGRDFTDKFFAMHNDTQDRFIEDICSISVDWVNDKIARLRILTMGYMQNTMTNFVKHYYSQNTEVVYV